MKMVDASDGPTGNPPVRRAPWDVVQHGLAKGAWRP